MEDARIRHRVLGDIARLIVGLDAELSKKDESAEEERKRLEGIIAIQNEKISAQKEAAPEVQHEKESLQEEVAALRRKNEELLHRNIELEDAEISRQKRSLRPKAASLENKENTETVISNVMKITPSGLKYAHTGTQTEPDLVVPMPSSYDELAKKYEQLRQQVKQYKEAHIVLSEKYRRNKSVWKEWVEADAERRRRTNEMKAQLLATRAASAALTTPVRPIGNTVGAWPSSPAAPNLSPDHAPVMWDNRVFSSPPTFQGDNHAIALDKTPVRLLKQSMTHHKHSHNHKSPTRMGKQPAATEQQVNPTEPNPYDSEETTDGEVGTFSPTSKAIFKETSHSPSLPTGPSAKIKKEDLTIASPVMIKSEPRSSISMDHLVFTQQSLDLDDIGHKPETPRKRRYMSNYRPRRAIGVLDHLEEEHVIAPHIPEQQHAGIPVQKETDAVGGVQVEHGLTPPQLDLIPLMIPTLPAPQLSGVHISGILEDSQPVERPTPVPARNSRQSLVNGYFKARADIPSGATTKELTTTAQQVNKSINNTKQKRQLKSKKNRGPIDELGIGLMTEDGTNGVDRLDRNGQTSIGASGILSGLLATPPDITPDIAHLRKSAEPGLRSVTPLQLQAAGKGERNERFMTPSATTEQIAKRRGALPATDPPVSKRSRLSTASERKAPPEPATDRTFPTSKLGKGKSKQAQQKLRDRAPQELNISDFRVNTDLGYAFQEVVRKRDERKCLPSCIKPCCANIAKFVKNAGVPTTMPIKGPKWRSSSPAVPDSDQDEGDELDDEGDIGNGDAGKEEKKFRNKFTKHRGHFDRSRSPHGFWNSDFPTTQELQAQHKAARKAEREKVDEMRREAKRSGGRFAFRDEV